jgi:hypothetical protein
MFVRRGGQAGRYPDQEALQQKNWLAHRATFLLTPNLKIPNELVKHTAVHSALSLWCVS